MPRPPLARPRALGASQFQGASSPARCQLSRGHTKPPSPSPPLGLLLLRRLLTLTSSDDAAEETDEPTSQPRSLQDCDAHQRCRNSQWQERGAAPDRPPGHRSYCSAAQSYAVMLATRRSTTPATPAHIMQTAHHSDKQNVECNMQCCDCFMLLHLRPTARTCADCGATALTGSSACSRRTL